MREKDRPAENRWERADEHSVRREHLVVWAETADRGSGPNGQSDRSRASGAFAFPQERPVRAGTRSWGQWSRHAVNRYG